MGDSRTTIDLITPPSSPHNKHELKETTTGASSTATVVTGSPTSSPPSNVHPKKQKLTHDVDDEEECVIVSSNGCRPHVDLPHARAECGVHPFSSVPMVGGVDNNVKDQNVLHCNNCYCFVCDKPVNECIDWDKHCLASDKDPYWKEERRKQNLDPLSQTLSEFQRSDPMKVLKSDMLPEFDSSSLSLKHKLFSYQNMVLQFIVNREKTGITPKMFHRYSQGHAYKDVPTTFGGIIACEVGMGKTAIFVALQLLFREKVTLFITKQDLVEQTVQEFNEWSNGQLKITKMYGATQRHIDSVAASTDIFIIGFGSVLPTAVTSRIKRIIIDESHELCMMKMNSPAMTFARNLTSTPEIPVWCISATPFCDWSNSSERLIRQARLIIHTHDPIRVNLSCTMKDARDFVLRFTKDQFPNEVQVADVERRKLVIKQSPMRARFYRYISCMDTCKRDALTEEDCEKPGADNMIRQRTRLRTLFLSEDYSELHSSMKSMTWLMDSCMENSRGSMSALDFKHLCDEFDYMLNTALPEIQKGRNDKLDGVLASIISSRSTNCDYKALIVTSDTAVPYSYLSEKSSLRVGKVQPSPKSPVHREHKILTDFQQGKYDVLVCSPSIISRGHNLQLACEIFFLDLIMDDTIYEQARGRISRVGSNHPRLCLTTLCPENTITDQVVEYHRRRNNGQTVSESLKIFIPDFHHTMQEPVERFDKHSVGDNNPNFDIIIQKTWCKWNVHVEFRDVPLFINSPIDNPCIGILVRLNTKDYTNHFYSTKFIIPRIFPKETGSSSSSTFNPSTTTLLDPQVSSPLDSDDMNLFSRMQDSSLPVFQCKLDDDNLERMLSIMATENQLLGKKAIDYDKVNDIYKIRASHPCFSFQLLFGTRGEEPTLSSSSQMLLKEMTISNYKIQCCSNCIYTTEHKQNTHRAALRDVPVQDDFRKAFKQFTEQRPEEEYFRFTPWGCSNGRDELEAHLKKSYRPAVVLVDKSVATGDKVKFTHEDKSYTAFVNEIVVVPYNDGLGTFVRTFVDTHTPNKDIVHIMSSTKLS